MPFENQFYSHDRAPLGIMGFSTEFWKQELWRALEFDSISGSC
jgi:hypothetical protein